MQSTRRPGCGRPIFVALVITVSACPLYGQGPRLPSPVASAAVRDRAPPFQSAMDSTAPKRTYWLEGGLIGAAGGVLLASLLSGLCEGNCGGDQRTVVMLVGGFIVGGLVGGGIEKKS
jgi:hypothetical protein